VKVRLDGERLTPGPVPVPIKLTLCVLPATLLALSVIVTAADSALVVVGVKVTLIVQVPPFAATELPHVLLAFGPPKSLELVPVIWMLVTDRAAFPVFVRVIL
jgi:hypothetical protein